MYIMGTLRNFRMELQTHHLQTLSKTIAEETGRCRAVVWLDMLFCSLHYGIKFAEYYNMDFAHRTLKNRETYITTNFNFRVYDKINAKENRTLFHNKIKFNQLFADYISRDWVEPAKISDVDFDRFLAGKRSIVLKRSGGDSGSSVEVLDTQTQAPAQILEYCRQKGFDLAEAAIENHKDLAFFNDTSLNTVRIVTVTNGERVHVLYAGLRVGAKGAKVDNISQGGAVASIDLKTGTLSRPFFAKKNSSVDGNLVGKDFVGYQLPFWDELLKNATEMALKAPKIGYVAWDISITPNGPEVIEGNESFGSVIMQADRGYEECGLKPLLVEILKDLQIRI